MFYDAEIVVELCSRMPNAQEVVFKEAGHMLPVEVGPAFAEELKGFADAL